jgi:hypothetical protein
MATTKYEYKWITEEVNVEASGYTSVLAASMQNTKEALMAQILLSSFRDIDKPYEIKVDFYD